ncbi:hypothetical protein [[Limnothrix rosea] IAM M-220]|uniref:hypothetical protein n=1 Tax=[Limnothrix rosea] IAM M-220 TaxID=454133 RepID=UPI0009637368|nr:hypothetical protein [[Limnothrix rosea] IAM M-220]OKH16961.1 hypothetical protein NIES208_11310 [[Limnothrix rosea] IAM M-220]
MAQSATEQSLRPAITNENDETFVNTLVKTTLVALNQANLTADYSVLRSLASEEFQANNSEEDLFLSFQPIREYGVDFGGVVEFSPIFSVQPTLDAANNLRVVGYFETSPVIEFDLVYQLVNGNFVTDGLTVGIRPTSNEE